MARWQSSAPSASVLWRVSTKPRSGAEPLAEPRRDKSVGERPGRRSPARTSVFPTGFMASVQAAWPEPAPAPELALANRLDCSGSGGCGCSADLSVALRSEEHTSELQSLRHLVCRLLLE